jgi:hypothetical protein
MQDRSRLKKRSEVDNCFKEEDIPGVNRKIKNKEQVGATRSSVVLGNEN